jgi:hypothetical protein
LLKAQVVAVKQRTSDALLVPSGRPYGLFIFEKKFYVLKYKPATPFW